MRFKDKVAIVTGGARGQGGAHVARLAREGARVIAADVLEEAGIALQDQLRGEQLDVTFRRLDVSNDAMWRDTVDYAVSAFGGVDILVNNAGITGFGTAEGLANENWERVVSVNQTGMFYGMRAVVPAMRLRGGGAIVNVSTASVLFAERGHFAYMASKGAVIAMSRSAAVDFAVDGIRVNTVLPGTIDTDMVGVLDPKDVLEWTAGIALKRLGRPEEITGAVLFLASDDASFITGTELLVDGGFATVDTRSSVTV